MLGSGLRILGLLLFVMAASGCTDAGSARPAAHADAAVPSYAAPSGAPSFCADLAGTTHLTDIPEAVGRLTADPRDVEAALLVCGQPTTAFGVPASPLCTPDGTRGGVPTDFVLDACVDTTSMTVGNDLDVLLLVRGGGDIGVPAHLHERGSATASVQRRLAGTEELLMPGDVVRWPLGAGAATLTVAGLEPTTTVVVDSLNTALPPLGADSADEETYQAYAVVVRDITAAVAGRAACVVDKNFLQEAACDVVAASAIGRTVIGHLPRAQAVELLPVVMDRGTWADWITPRRTALTSMAPSRLTLTQAALQSPPPPPDA